MFDSICGIFPLFPIFRKQVFTLKAIYDIWNSMINVISRKDIDNFFVHHVLHSLSIAKVISLPGTTNPRCRYGRRISRTFGHDVFPVLTSVFSIQLKKNKSCFIRC